MKMHQMLVRSAGVILLAGLGTATAHADWLEDFDTVSGPTPLETQSGWTDQSGSSQIANVNGGIVTTNYSPYTIYDRQLNTSEKVTDASGFIDFSMDFRFTSSDDRSNDMYFYLGESSGTNRFIIKILGGTNTGAGDNQVQISDGYDSGDSTHYITYNDTTTNGNDGGWVPNTAGWYTIKITGISLSSTQTGGAITGTFSLLYTNGSTTTTKIDPVTITAFGNDSLDPFNEISFFRFDRADYGASGGWAFDNFTLTSSAPEPATLALIGLGGLCLISRRSQIMT